MSISTGTGDSGESGLIGGQRVPKDDPRLETYGTVDELSAAIGMARSASPPETVEEQLGLILEWLFQLGADLATPGCGLSPDQPARLTREILGELESWIHREEDSLPRLRHFILPGGAPSAAALHFARTVCRRAERHLVTHFRRTGEGETALVFLNRLSDLLFLYARRANVEARVSDVEWTP